MKLVITKREYKTGLVLAERLGYEVDKIVELVREMNDGDRVVVEKTTKTLTLESKEVLDELNEFGRKFLVVTKTEEGFEFDINEEFAVEATDLYGEGIARLIRSIGTVVKDMCMFLQFQMQDFLDKWS